MVFLTCVNLLRKNSPDKFWKRRQVFKLTAHYFGRKRNCYSIAIRSLHKALVYATQGRKLKITDRQQLWETRIEGASEELGVKYSTFMEGLARNNIVLNRKTLSDLAIWEPRTFQCLTDVIKQR